jgi:hypothetical protein
MPDLDLQALPADLRAALERAWPGSPEAQRRALLGPRWGWPAVWPELLWAWQPPRRWWRAGLARRCREQAEALFVAPVRDVRQDQAARLFDPAQPFFDTPWTHAATLLRSPVPAVFSDAEFWAMTQQVFGGDVVLATQQAQDWARGMQAEGALQGSRRRRWLQDALWRWEMSATGTFL